MHSSDQETLILVTTNCDIGSYRHFTVSEQRYLKLVVIDRKPIDPMFSSIHCYKDMVTSLR